MKCLICKEEYTDEEIREMDESFIVNNALICCDCYDKFLRMDLDDRVKLFVDNNKTERNLESDLKVVCNYIMDIERAVKNACDCVKEFNSNYEHFNINYRVKDILNNMLTLMNDIKDYKILMGLNGVTSYLEDDKWINTKK